MASSRSFGERVRRNHALEHATLHVLARDLPDLSLVGRSDWRGFLIYGDIQTEKLRQAAVEAWERLRSGQVELSIHPHCGTNLAVASLLTGLAIFVSQIGNRRSGWKRWPVTAFAVLGALSLAVPLGPAVQRRMTTDPDMEGVAIGTITCVRAGRMPTHRVEIEHEI